MHIWKMTIYPMNIIMNSNLCVPWIDYMDVVCLSQSMMVWTFLIDHSNFSAVIVLRNPIQRFFARFPWEKQYWFWLLHYKPIIHKFISSSFKKTFIGKSCILNDSAILHIKFNVLDIFICIHIFFQYLDVN